MKFNTFRINAFMSGEIIAFIIMAAVVAMVIPNLLYALLPGFTLIYLILRFSYSLTSRRHIIGQWTLLAVALIMGIGITLNINMFSFGTADANLSNPILHNNDSFRYYYTATSIFNNEPSVLNSASHGYQYLICLIWGITGVNVVVPLLINYAFTLSSIIMTSFITIRIFDGTIDNNKLPMAGGISMLLISVCCNFIGWGMVIIKEPLVYFGMALIAYNLAGTFRFKAMNTRKTIVECLIFVIGTTIIAFTRHSLVYLILLGIPLLATYPKSIKRSLCFIGITALTFSLGFLDSPQKLDTHVQVIQSQNMENSNYINTEHGAYNKVVTKHFESPVVHKILTLPFFAAVQFFVPFPWNFTRYEQFGITQAYNLFGYTWYIVGFLIIFFLFIKDKPNIWRWLLFGAIAYLVPAYLFAGSVSRYYLPYLPILIVPACYSVLSLIEHWRKYRKTFIISGSIYASLIVITLITCNLILSKNL